MQDEKARNVLGGLVEAGWLAAAVIIPVLTNSFGEQIFDAPKSFFLEAIALVMGVSWLTGRALLPARKGDRAPLSGLLFWTTLAVAATQVLSAALSFLPLQAFWGSASRFTGVFTWMALLGLFLLTLDGLRTREQVVRLLLAVSAGSVPVALYSVVQSMGMDPFFWQTTFAGRVFSTIGNPIFAGAYFGLACFASLAAWLMLAPGSGTRPETGAFSRRSVARVVLAPVVLLQVAALLLTESRGPELAFVVGIFCAAFFHAVAKRRQNAVRWMAGLALVGAALLLGALAGVPGLGALRGAIDPAVGTGRVRVMFWKAAAASLSPRAALPLAPGMDRMKPYRQWIGYGPDCIDSVTTRYLPAEMNALGEHKDLQSDKTHNVFWDVLISTGFIGFAAYVLFLLAVLRGFSAGWLGAEAARGRRAFWLPLAGMGLCAVLALASGSTPWLGVFLFLGLLIGFLLHCALPAPSSAASLPDAAPRPDLAPVAAVLAGACISHLAEIQLGIPVVPTLMLFFLLAAAALALTRIPAGQAELAAAAEEERAARPAGKVRGLSAIGLLSGALFSVAIFPFLALLTAANRPADAADLQFMVGFLSWLCALLLLRAGFPSAKRETLLRSVLTSLVPIAACVGLALVFLGGSVKVAAGRTLLDVMLDSAGTSCLVYLLFLLVTLAAAFSAAFFLPQRTEGGPGAPRGRGRAVVSGVLAAVLVVGGFGVLSREMRRIKGDIYFQTGNSFASRGAGQIAAAFYLAACRETLSNRLHWIRLADILMARGAKDAAKNKRITGAGAVRRYARTKLFPETSLINKSGGEESLALAQLALKRAYNLDPGNHLVNLEFAQYYATLARLESQKPMRQVLLDKSGEFYRRAAEMFPTSPTIPTLWAKTVLTVGRNQDLALAKARQAVALAGDAYEAWALIGEVLFAKKDYRGAFNAAKKVLEKEPENQDALNMAALSAFRAKDYDNAIWANRKMLELSTESDSQKWTLIQNISIALAEKGNFPAAIAEMHRAIALAPKAQKEDANRMLKKLLDRQAQVGTPSPAPQAPSGQ